MIARHVEVGLGHHGILAHDVEGADAARVRMTKISVVVRPEVAGQPPRLDVPGGLPVGGVLLVVDTHVARVVERHGTHIACALHVVLTTQRIQARAIPAHMAGEKGKMNERQCAGSSV